MNEETLQQLVDFVKEVSPLIWQILIKQVYVEAIGNLAWVIGLSVLTYVLYQLICRMRENGDDDDPVVIISWMGVVIAGISALLLLTSAVQRFINPEFYVIRYLLSSFGQ